MWLLTRGDEARHDERPGTHCCAGDESPCASSSPGAVAAGCGGSSGRRVARPSTASSPASTASPAAPRSAFVDQLVDWRGGCPVDARMRRRSR